MKIGVVITTKEPEKVWNALRFCIVSLDGGYQVKAFLLGEGVEIENIASEKFDVKKNLQTFIDKKGELMACGTCLKIRQREQFDICPISTMKDLLKLVEQSDRVVTF